MRDCTSVKLCFVPIVIGMRCLRRQKGRRQFLTHYLLVANVGVNYEEPVNHTFTLMSFTTKAQLKLVIGQSDS